MTIRPSTDPNHGWPLWLRGIDESLPITGSYVIHGNIHDHYPVPVGGSIRPMSMLSSLWQVLKASGYQSIIYHHPSYGFSVFPDTAESMKAAADMGIGWFRETADAEEIIEVMTNLNNTSPALVARGRSHSVRAALVLDYVSQWRQEYTDFSHYEHHLFITLLTHLNNPIPVTLPGPRKVPMYNPVFWLVDHIGDLPSWFINGSTAIRQISVGLPTQDERASIAPTLLAQLQKSKDEDGLAKAVSSFVRVSQGMTIREMQDSVRLALDKGLPMSRITDAARATRVGILENPWSGETIRKSIAEGEAKLKREVLGQERAIRASLDILIRATTGMSSAHKLARDTGPRGVLFFAGPTGVGKTKLAKSLTKLIFGDERSYIRFDMSEFAIEHNEARLVGSPPGYRDSGRGGELTDAVLRRPHSLILFDEIEKAHPRVLDKFLQILSDGRLTSGMGTTVHFSETLIVFTSNLGVPSERPSTFEELEAQVIENIKEAFTNKPIERPELIGRLEGNFVVFDYLQADAARDLAGQFVNNIIAHTRSQLGIELSVSPAVRAQLIESAAADTAYGGRGIGKQIESLFVDPLSRALFGVPAGSKRTVVTLGTAPGGWPEVVLE